jgi:hypothetical protein
MIDERIDRTKLTSASFDEAEADDIAYWLSKTPAERIEGIEYLRRCIYGDDAIDAPVQRVLTFGNLGDE